jgi:hypothetical protein
MVNVLVGQSTRFVDHLTALFPSICNNGTVGLRVCLQNYSNKYDTFILKKSLWEVATLGWAPRKESPIQQEVHAHL